MADARAAIAAGTAWLECHAAYLLPDTLAFAEIGLRAARLPLPRRLTPPGAGRTARSLVPLSPAFRRVAAGAGPLYRGFRGEPPLASRRTAARRASPPRSAGSPLSGTMDGQTINRALAESVRGRLSPASLQWMCQRGQRDFLLTHQLLAWLFCVWSHAHPDAPRMARRAARAVFREARQAGAYYDLFAQQTAFLALGAWPHVDLRLLVARILAAQDAGDGGWHYFETHTVTATETLSRVLCGWSPLMRWPVPCEEKGLDILARAIHDAHRGHATGLSICALGVVWKATIGAG